MRKCFIAILINHASKRIVIVGEMKKEAEKLWIQDIRNGEN